MQLVCKTMHLLKDLYEYIACLSDDYTVLNMLSVNKTFQDSIYFKRIMSKRYPYLVKMKPEEQTWKSFYVEMIYYNSILEKDYNIPYIPARNYNPKKLFHEKNYSSISFKKCNRALRYAVEAGLLDTVKILSEKTEIHPELGLHYSAYVGNFEMVKIMIEKGACDFNTAIGEATRGGELEMVKFMIEKGATTFVYACSYAIANGNSEIEELIIEKGHIDSSILERLRARYSPKID